jgi:hypothetical protein
MIEHIRKLLSLFESTDVIFTDSQMNILDQFGYPIQGFKEALNDPNTTLDEIKEIKIFLETLLSDGGFWGETINSHSQAATNLKQKIIDMLGSIG